MNKAKKINILIWLIILSTLIINYILIRFSGLCSKILRDNLEETVYGNFLLEVGIFLFVFAGMILCGFYLYHICGKKDYTIQNIFVLCFLFSGTLLASLIAYRYSPYAMPLVILPLIISFISNKHIAVCVTVVMTLFIIPIAYGYPEIIFMHIFTGILASLMASKVEQRKDFPILGLVLTACNVFVMFIFQTLKGFNVEEFLQNTAIVSIITFGCVIATIGALPFFETISGIISIGIMTKQKIYQIIKPEERL